MTEEFEWMDFATEVRAGDYERFLAIQLAPHDKRQALYAVTAYALMLAQVAETVSEPLLGHIRLAWWREALEEIIAGTQPRRHPLVQTLAALHRETPGILPRLLPIAEVRAADLDPSLLATQQDWLHYLDHTAGALHTAWAALLTPGLTDTQEALVRSQARAYAMVGLLLSIPYHTARGAVRFSQAQLDQYGLTELTPSVALESFVKDVTEEAHRILMGIKSLRPWRPIYALSYSANRSANSIKKEKYKIVDVKKSKLSLVLRMIQVKLFLC